MNLNCNEFEQRLRESIESRERLDRADLLDHAKTCGVCRAIWEREVMLDRVIPAWRERVPQADLVEPVLAQLAFGKRLADTLPVSHESGPKRADSLSRPAVPRRRRVRPTDTDKRHKHQRGSRPAAVGVLALAATVLFLVAQPLLRPAGQQLVQSDATRIIVATARGPVENGIHGRAKPQSLPGEARAYGPANLAVADHQASDGIVLVSPVEFSATNVEAAEIGLEQLPTWVNAWGRELEPIRDNLSSAIDLLLDVVPSENSPAL